MNKAELALALHERTAVAKAQAERTVEEILKIITEKLVAGEEVALSGFGAFSAKKRKGRVGVNPRDTKQSIQIPSVTVAKFKPGKNLKDILKRKDRPMAAPAAPAAPSSAKATDDKPTASQE